MLTDTFRAALDFAAALHQDHRRKGTDIPYVSHLLAVTAIVLEAGGDERQATGALLHDAVEDRPDGGRTRSEIEGRFGQEVLDIVLACTDDLAGDDDRSVENWRERKTRYVAHVVELGKARSPALLVSLADKVHNARAIVADLRRHGSELWERFNAGREDQLWYYRALADGFREAIEYFGNGEATASWSLWESLEDAVLEMEATAQPERRRQPVILVPSTGPADWKRLLADPGKHWKRDKSARSLAESWEAAQGFPDEIRALLATAPELADLEPLFVIPEYQVPLPGGGRASQTDALVLAKGAHGMAVLAIEGKQGEDFGPTMAKWRTESKGKRVREAALAEALGLPQPIPGHIRYQLVHRTASAVLEAKRLGCRTCAMIIHAFPARRDHYDDFDGFGRAIGANSAKGRMVHAAGHLWLGWAEPSGRIVKQPKV